MRSLVNCVMKRDSATSSPAKSFQNEPFSGDLCTRRPRSERPSAMAVDAAWAAIFSMSDFRLIIFRLIMEAMFAAVKSRLRDSLRRSVHTRKTRSDEA